MKTITSHADSDFPLRINVYSRKGKDKKVFVIVGGFGDDRNYFANLIKQLQSKFRSDFVTFSFRGVEEKKALGLNQQARDLEEVVKHVSKKYEDLMLICTSDGQFSTSKLLATKHAKLVSSAIYLDPADYYLEQGDRSPWEFIWSGYQKYKPAKKTSSDLLKEIKSDTKIHVVNFTIRNYGKNGYAPENERGKDNPKLFARLSNDMVKAFYVNTPENNKGKYIEDNTSPHAFMRDGNVKQNIKKIADLISKLGG